MTIDEFETRARRGEISPFSWVSIPALTGEKFVQARELPLFVALYDPRRIHFRKHFQIGRLPVLTVFLSLACVALFFVSKHLGDGVVTREALLVLGAKAAARIIEDGATWRLLTANVLHRDGVHLAFNLFALLNIGTVLEGVYRRGDYILLLVVSGLATMVVSAAMSPPVTVGASGLVFGCLGAAVVFGWRFGDVLPRRYRIYFGLVVLGYVTVMFYLGLRSGSTDNWGHGGGLVAGVLMGMLLEPRLMRLTATKESVAVTARPYLLAGILAGTTLLVGPLLPHVAFRYQSVDVDAFGVRLKRPLHWNKVAGPLGFFAFGNNVDAFTSLGCARLEQRSQLPDAVNRFVQGELRALERSGSIGQLEIGRPKPAVIGRAKTAPAIAVPFSLLASEGPFAATAVLFSRGQLECALVLAQRPGAPQGTSDRLDEILKSVSLVETKAQREARSVAEKRPDAARSWLSLALAHQAAGEIALARSAFSRAEALVDTQRAWAGQVAFGRAAFELEYGDDASAALAAARKARAEDNGLDTRLLYADALIANGETAAARSELEGLAKDFPKDKRVKIRLEATGPQEDAHAAP